MENAEERQHSISELAKIAAVYAVFGCVEQDEKALEAWNTVTAMTSDDQLTDWLEETGASVWDEGVYGDTEAVQEVLLNARERMLMLLIRGALPGLEALESLLEWNNNNVAYWPDIAESGQNSGEANQPPEDLSQNIDAEATRLLHEYELALEELKQC